MVKVALFKQNGSIKYKDFVFENNDFEINDLELLIENKGNNDLELIEEGFLNNKYYIIFGYKNGNMFSQHEFETQNIFGDAIMLIGVSELIEDLINITETDVLKYFSYECISSSSISINNSSDDGYDLDQYDFMDGFLINDL
jgi:hypothetical protein